MEILENHKDDFGTDFSDNKKNLDQFSIIRSKGLKNEIAGYITKFLKHEMLDKKKREEREAHQAKIEEESPEENLDMPEQKTETETPTESAPSETPTESTPSEAQEIVEQSSEN